MHPTLQKWHTFVQSQDISTLNDLLAEEVTFHSPVVWTPQEGKPITTLYLAAAVQVLSVAGNGFKYIREVVSDNQLILEFSVEVDGITINGIDMMELNEVGQIIDFKVMVRPLKAMHKLQEKMAEMLQKYSA